MSLYDIMTHIFDVISHSMLFRLDQTTTVYTTIKAFIDEICGRLTLIFSIMSVWFVTNNVFLFLVLSFSFAFLFSVKTHGCGRRAEGRGDAWAKTQDVRRPGLSSPSGLFCPLFACLFFCVYVGMSLLVCSACLNALRDWFPSLMSWFVGQNSQIWSTWGTVALNSDDDAKTDEGFIAQRRLKGVMSRGINFFFSLRRI